MIETQEERIAAAAAPSRPTRLTRPVTVLVPTYGSADKLQLCLRSLKLHAPPQCRIYVLDDATPDDSVESICAQDDYHDERFTYVRSEANVGFVRNCNWGFANFWDSKSDLLLLNSDTEVTAGFLEEMQAVLDLHEKHAVATPRSNNATIFSIPYNGEQMGSRDSFQVWEKLRLLLPRYQVVPTAVGFCMLIKREILHRFTLFDEIYSPGYNEENDFVCRINRLGYSAVSVNWAFVFHYESSSFGTRRAELEAWNRTTLLKRYPEYPKKVQDYVRFRVDPIEEFAVLYRSHRPRVLYDLFHVPLKHCGTSEFGLSLLREISRINSEAFDLFIGIRQDQLAFFAAELRGYRCCTATESMALKFDLIFKPSQVFTWDEYRFMNSVAPRVSYTLQDIIGVRCEYLSAASRELLFKHVAELSDCTFTISAFSKSDFEAFYGLHLPMHVIHHGTSLRAVSPETVSDDHILVVGNSYVHKGLNETLENLETSERVLVLGSTAAATMDTRQSVKCVPSGDLGRQELLELFARARVVVYLSHYEGFGLPVVDALALGKPVIALDTAVNRELQTLTGRSNFHLIGSVREVSRKLNEVLQQHSDPTNGQLRQWKDAAHEYVSAFQDLLSQDVDLVRLRARWELLRLLEAS